MFLSATKPELLVSSKDYFDDLVGDVLKEGNSLEVHPFAKVYLSELLNSFMHIDALFIRDESGRVESKMLSEQFFESQVLTHTQKINKLKKLAETTLYVSGFFGASLNRKLVNQSYYIQIGAMVYLNLSTIVDKDKNSELYNHLAHNFVNYSDVLAEVSQRTSIQKNDNILELFDRYLDSGSKWAEKGLIQNGIPLDQIKKNQN